MNRIAGVFCNGQVILNQPVDWAEGATVTVLCETGGARANTEVCCDGSRWDDTLEGAQSWVAWFDSLTPVFSGEELARFDADLRLMREEQKALLPRWQERTTNLLR